MAALQYKRLVENLYELMQTPLPQRFAYPDAEGVMGMVQVGRNESKEERLAREDAQKTIGDLIEEIRIYKDGPDADKRGGGGVKIEVCGQMAVLMSTGRTQDPIGCGGRI